MKSNIRRIQLAAALLSSLLIGSSCRAQVVTSTNDSGAGSLRQLINEAAPGATISTMVFLDPDQVRRARPKGFYRAFLRTAP